MRSFLIEKCAFTRRLVNKTCLFTFYYRTAQPHERCNISLLCALIFQLRKGSDAARWKSTSVFSFKVHSCFVVAVHYSESHSVTRAFSSHFSYLLSFADHHSSPTLIRSQVSPAAAAIVSFWKKKKKGKARLLPGTLSSIFHPQRLPFTSVNCFISCC